MKLLKLEFFKCRHRKILLVCAAVLAVELIWMGAFFTRSPLFTSSTSYLHPSNWLNI